MASHHAEKLALLKRLRDLGVRLEAIEHHLDAPHSKDWAELATEREDDEVMERLGQSGQAEIDRIMHALDRMAEGTYGICVSCGETISDARLAVLPETPLCRTCANRQ